MKRAIIFFNGNLSDIRRAKSYIKKTDYIICADGGTKYALQLGLTPHAIIGDNDSLSLKLQNKLTNQLIEWVKFPTDKNETDSELAMQFAVEKGYKEIIIFGLLGSRLDHLLTNIFALINIEKKGVTVVAVEGHQEIQVISKQVILKGSVADLVSLVPINGDAVGITTNGLQYRLLNDTLRFGLSRGISNVFTGTKAEINLKKGELLVIHTKKK